MTQPAPEPQDSDLDRALVAHFLAARSEEAFLRLYDRHTPALYRFAGRLTGGGGPEMADIVQEAWARAVSRLGSFREGSSLRTWLCGIVLNCVREKRRQAGRERAMLEVVTRETEVAPAHEPSYSRAFERAIAALPDGYREVLLLHDVEGYTHAEIAEHFGIAEGTSKSQLHRARLALRAALAEKEAVHGG